ncbi:hypothetical protein AB0G05_02515 [Nonomuraea wenchangensis]
MDRVDLVGVQSIVGDGQGQGQDADADTVAVQGRHDGEVASAEFVQEIKAFHDALPGPSATATARAKDLLAAETTAGPAPHAGVVRRRVLLRTGTAGLAAAAAVAFPAPAARPAGRRCQLASADISFKE